ncbi:vWA domain-containing protein [Litchfieldella anticariensis]|nr:VWA domain-containing protein [Halomonas anticariensis]
MSSTLIGLVVLMMACAPSAALAQASADLELPSGEIVARLVGDDAETGRLDVALEALGAKVVHVSSERYSYSGKWSAEGLIDGFARIRNALGSLVSDGWQNEPDDWPPEVVIGFHDERAPVVDTLILEPAAERHLPIDFAGSASPSEVPRFVEVLAGESPEPEAFERVATVRLSNRTVPQRIEIAPRAIRYLKLRVLENYGAPTMGLAEVKVFEAPSAASILDDVERNLARPALGGELVAFTSQDRDNLAIELVDGRADRESGWASAESTVGDAARLPQDLVFGFRGHRVAMVERVEIDPTSGSRYAVGNFDENWPRLVSIGVSQESPSGPFEALGRFELTQQSQAQSIPVGRPARYLRVRVLENHGGARTTIGEIAIIEAISDAGSVLVGEIADGWNAGIATSDDTFSLPDGRGEREPNDEMPESLLLGSQVAGAIEPLDDIDRFALALPGDEARMLRLDAHSGGLWRLAFDLDNAAGATVKRFRPSARSGNRIDLTWQLNPGDYRLSLWEPERITALVWDTSDSMEGRAEALERAVRGYVESLGKHESLLLFPFSDDVESLLDQPSREQPDILEALEGHFRPFGGTHWFDALAEALEALAGHAGQKTIIALTDGQDTGSETPLPELRQRLQASDARLIAIGLGPDLDELGMATGATGHGVLRSLAQLGSGRYVVQPSSADLPALYAAIAEELSGIQHYALAATAVEATGRLAVRQIGEPIPSIVAAPGFTLVLDGSGSMRRQIDGQPMIEIAREVMTELVGDLPDAVEVGLWTFGHRVREGQTGDCTDIEQLVPLGPLNRERLLASLSGVAALGTTPISETLERIGAALPRDGNPQLIVLVTDGEEECRSDLLEVVEALDDDGLQLSLNIVGFALDRPEVLAQLAEAAEAGQGRFVNAAQASDLAAAIEGALAVPFSVHDVAGDVVGAGLIGDSAIDLPVGRYTVRVETRDSPLVVQDIEVVADTTTEIRLDKQAEDIGVAIMERP